MTYEVCPHCECEVELDAELKVQTCPNCGKRIVTCSMCAACNDALYGNNYCNNCCLEYQAHKENEENMTLAELIREEIRQENPLANIMEKMVKAIHDGIKNDGDILVLCNGNIKESHVENWGSVCIAKKDESTFVDWCRKNGIRMRDSYNYINGGKAGYVLSL